MPKVSVKVSGLSRAAEIPGWLETGQKDFVRTIGSRIAEVVEETSPSGRIPFESSYIDSTTVRVFSNHPGAKVLDVGGYIKPKKSKRLRFQVNGRQIFTKYAVRIPAFNYTKKANRKRNKIVAQEFDKIFSDIEKA